MIVFALAEWQGTGRGRVGLAQSSQRVLAAGQPSPTRGRPPVFEQRMKAERQRKGENE